MISICRDTSGNVKRWRDGQMALHWCTARMIEAGKQFRRVNGHLPWPRYARRSGARSAKPSDPSCTMTSCTSHELSGRHRSFTEHWDILQSRGKAPVPGLSSRAGASRTAGFGSLPAAELADLIQSLTDQMQTAAGELQFEVVARQRDEIKELKRELRGMLAAGAV